MYLTSRLPRLYTSTAQLFAISSGRFNSNIGYSEERIEIPNRVQRSPTDILNALASTVGRDPTAAHYKYHDDPYLIPMSNVGKRTFAMSQEAGRKAARFIREEHRDVFKVMLYVAIYIYSDISHAIFFLIASRSSTAY